MSFLKQVADKLTKAAEVTVKKTGELTDTAKLKLDIARMKSDIETKYTEIGMLVYKQYHEQTDESSAVAEKCLAIDALNDSLEHTLLIIEEKRAAAQVAKEEAAKAKAEAEVVCTCEDTCTCCGNTESVQASECPACGAEIAADAAFCSKCGQKI
ncbi:MAG: zinc ribbon domain-containing protein [Clostridia bacterium]|nr:zinc ribbon domain-containing protein [Clostridia bacterium]